MEKRWLKEFQDLTQGLNEDQKRLLLLEKVEELDLKINTKEEIMSGIKDKAVNENDLKFYISKRRGKRRCYKEIGILLDKKVEAIFKDCSWTIVKNKSGIKYVLLQKRIQGKTYTKYLHRIITNCPKGKIVDHINGNGLDNRNKNLRIVSVRENANNMKRHRNGKYVGIFYSKKDNLWVARIRNKGKRYSLGCYKTPEDAQNAYLKEKRKIERRNR